MKTSILVTSQFWTKPLIPNFSQTRLPQRQHFAETLGATAQSDTLELCTRRLQRQTRWAMGFTRAVAGVALVGLLWTLFADVPLWFGASLGCFLVAALGLLMLQNAWRESTLELEREAARLRDVSRTDGLTGGFNRLQVEKIVAAEMSRATRHDRPLSLIMFDLDNFKAVNDTKGHAAGDDVLCEVWRCASRVVREIDTVARWGGDEFLIVLPETAAPEAHSIALRLQDEVQIQLRRLFDADAVQSRITLSLGIAMCQGCGALSVEALVSQADARLYEAKRAGKNRIAW